MCPDCQHHATDEQIAELLTEHTARLQAAFDEQLRIAIEQVVAQVTTSRAPYDRLH